MLLSVYFFILITLAASFGNYESFSSASANYHIFNANPYESVTNLFECFKSENVSVHLEYVRTTDNSSSLCGPATHMRLI